MKKTHVFSRALAVNLNFIRRCYVLVGMWGGQSSWLSLVEISERISIGTMDPISKYDNPFQFQMFALRVTASCFLPCHWTNCPCQRFQATPNNNSTKQSSKKTPLQHFETQFLPEKSPKKTLWHFIYWEIYSGISGPRFMATIKGVSFSNIQRSLSITQSWASSQGEGDPPAKLTAIFVDGPAMFDYPITVGLIIFSLYIHIYI